MLLQGCYVMTFSLSTENARILSLKEKTLRFLGDVEMSGKNSTKAKK